MPHIPPQRVPDSLCVKPNSHRNVEQKRVFRCITFMSIGITGKKKAYTKLIIRYNKNLVYQNNEKSHQLPRNKSTCDLRNQHACQR